VERLGDDARNILRDAGAGEIGAIAEVVAVWPEAVGAEVARQAWPRRIARDGALLVATSSSTWAYELDRLSPEILARLRASLGDVTPPRLRFAPGLVPEPSGPPAGVPTLTVRPTAAELGEAARLTAGIESHDLRTIAARAAALALARRRDDLSV
jgi:hypothetical protein